jgi:hypothetical protein
MEEDYSVMLIRQMKRVAAERVKTSSYAVTVIKTLRATTLGMHSRLTTSQGTS